MTDSTERYFAEMEAARYSAEAAYFDARPSLDQDGQAGETFRAGFEHAFKLLWSPRQQASAPDGR